MTRKMLIVVVLALSLFGCQHNLDSVSEGPDSPDNAFPEQVSFSIKNATLTFDGKVLSEQLTLTEGDFGFFFLWVKDEGLFAVTIHPISLSVPAGQFAGNKMRVQYQDHDIELISQSEHLFGDAKDRGAYLVYTPDFDMFGPDVKPADAVIGAATELNQRPGDSN
jgi:hypothetical protein